MQCISIKLIDGSELRDKEFIGPFGFIIYFCRSGNVELLNVKTVKFII